MSVHGFRIVTTAIAVALAGGFQLYSMAVCNNLVDVVKQWLNETYTLQAGRGLSDYELTTFWAGIAASQLVGGLIGCTTVSPIADRFGRRIGLLACAVLTILGATLSGVSKVAKAYPLLIVGRLFVGYSLGCSVGISQLYLLEIPPLRYRGVAGSVTGLAAGAGVALAVVVSGPWALGTERFWPLAFGLQAITSLIGAIVLLFAKESPRYFYLQVKAKDRAEQALRYFQSMEDTEKSLADLISEDAHMQEKRSTLTWRKFLCGKRFRLRLALVFALNAVSVFCGVVAVQLYSSEMLHRTGMEWDTADRYVLVLGILQGAFSPISLLVDKIGRRKILLTGYVGCCLSLIIFSIVSEVAVKKNEPGTILVIAGVCLILHAIFYRFQRTVSMLLTGELFEQDARAMAVSVANVTHWSCGVITAFTLPVSLVKIGAGLSVIHFIVITTVLGSFIAAFLPETKFQTMEEVSRRFEGTELPNRSTAIHPQPPVNDDETKTTEY